MGVSSIVKPSPTVNIDQHTEAYTKPTITRLGQLNQFVREGGGGYGVDGPGELIGDKIYYPSWSFPQSN